MSEQLREALDDWTKAYDDAMEPSASSFIGPQIEAFQAASERLRAGIPDAYEAGAPGVGEERIGCSCGDIFDDEAAFHEHRRMVHEGTNSPGSLDAAWAAAEAALPEGWRMGSLRAAVGFNGRTASTIGWTATAHSSELIGDAVDRYAATPAAALRALAAALSTPGAPES